MAAAAFQLQILSRGDETVRQAVGRYLHPATGIGLLIAVSAGTIGALGYNFFKGVWVHLQFGFIDLEVGTPVIFDLGVFLVVVSFATSYLLGLSRAERSQS
jgi:multicomponent Na+:H+ antiporter subunit B